MRMLHLISTMEVTVENPRGRDADGKGSV